MNAIFNAAYAAIFISFVRKIVDKVSIPLEASITIASKKHTDEWYVLVNDHPVDWNDDRDEAYAFAFSCIARCRSLNEKMSILENEDMVLEEVESIPGLSEAEIDAVNATIDEYG